MAEKEKAASAEQAAGGGSTAKQLDESRPARAAADEQATDKSRVSLPGSESGGEVGTTDKPLEGVLPFGVAQAGGPEGHEKFVASDPHVYESRPGQSGVEAVGSGVPPTVDAAKAMRDRANAGIPEPPKVGPIPNTTLLDTPGGYQVVPAGFTPDKLAEHQADLRAKLAVPQSAEETGADVRVVAGPGAE